MNIYKPNEHLHTQWASKSQKYSELLKFVLIQTANRFYSWPTWYAQPLFSSIMCSTYQAYSCTFVTIELIRQVHFAGNTKLIFNKQLHCMKLALQIFHKSWISFIECMCSSFVILHLVAFILTYFSTKTTRLWHLLDSVRQTGVTWLIQSLVKSFTEECYLLNLGKDFEHNK